jgi:hypothetical protein
MPSSIEPDLPKGGNMFGFNNAVNDPWVQHLGNVVTVIAVPLILAFLAYWGLRLLLDFYLWDPFEKQSRKEEPMGPAVFNDRWKKLEKVLKWIPPY